MVSVGAPATDWANDGLFGDGWHLFGIGSLLNTLKWPITTPTRSEAQSVLPDDHGYRSR